MTFYGCLWAYFDKPLASGGKDQLEAKRMAIYMALMISCAQGYEPNAGGAGRSQIKMVNKGDKDVLKELKML